MTATRFETSPASQVIGGEAGGPLSAVRPGPAAVDAPAPATTAGAGAPDITITVYGQPITQGSKTRGRYGMYDDNAAKLRPWRAKVKNAALDALTAGRIGDVPVHRPPLDGPVYVEVTFTVAKPASAPKRRRTWPIKQRSGDIDKLTRAAFDSLTDAGVWKDDSQVVEVLARKSFPGEHPAALGEPGAVIHVWCLREAVTG